MLDSLCGEQGIRELLNHRSLPSHHQHLQAVIMVEMNMKRGEDVVVEIVLHVRELLGELANMVVVDQRKGAHDMAVRRLPRGFDEFFPNEVPERFRAVGVPPFRDQ